MKKYITFLIVFVLLICAITPYISFIADASVTQVDPNNGNAWSVPYAVFNEPPELPNVCYWVLDNPQNLGTYHRNDSCYFFVLVFPFLYEQSLQESEIVVTLELESDGQTLHVVGPNLGGNYFYCYIYNFNGPLLDSHIFQFPTGTGATTGFYYKFTFSKDCRKFWFKGPISYTLQNLSYAPAILNWRNDNDFINQQLIDIMRQNNYNFAAIATLGIQLEDYFDLLNTQVGDIYDGEMTISDQLSDIEQTIRDEFSYYENMFSAYVRTNQQQLSNILDGVNLILNLLRGNSNSPTYPVDETFNNIADEYMSMENQNIADINSGVNTVSGYNSNIVNLLNNTQSGFAGIRTVFNLFIENQPINYIPLLFCLIIGLFTFLIGKRIPNLSTSRTKSNTKISKKR